MDICLGVLFHVYELFFGFNCGVVNPEKRYSIKSIVENAVCSGDCRAAIRDFIVDAKDIGRGWDFKQDTGHEYIMVGGSALFLTVAKSDDYSCEYMDWHTIHVVDVFRDFNEYTK